MTRSPTNSAFLYFISPLIKWKLLDIDNLMIEGGYPAHRMSFYRLLTKLNKSGVLGRYKDPWKNKNYYYLSNLGKQMVGDLSSSSVSNETIAHDSRVVNLVRELVDLEVFESFELESELKEMGLSPLPDARLKGVKKDKSFNVALELELTQKSKSRIKEKIHSYLRSDAYDFVIYFFAHVNLMNNYRQIIKEQVGEHAFERVLLFTSKEIMTRDLTLDSAKGIYKNKEVSFDELFKK